MDLMQKKQFKVKVKKVRKSDNPLHEFSFINDGYEFTGFSFDLPQVGEAFWLITKEGLGYFHTSTVVEILDNYHFRTMNSIYYYEILKDDKTSMDSGGLGEDQPAGPNVPPKSGAAGAVDARAKLRERARKLLEDFLR